jgi:hypothetical protein
MIYNLCIFIFDSILMYYANQELKYYLENLLLKIKKR